MKSLIPFIILVLLGLIAFGAYQYFYKNTASDENNVLANSAAVEDSTSAEAVTDTSLADDTATSNSDENASTESDYDPSLWKIEHNGVTSYLFGSIHLGDQSMYPLPQEVTDAFAATNTLAVEIDINKINQMEMAQMVQTMAIDMENPLPTVLSEKTKEAYDTYCETAKAQCQMLNNFEPWMAAMTLEVINAAQSGYSDQLGIDKHFISNAQDKEIVELESLQMQLELLDGMSAELQDLMFFAAVTKEDDSTHDLIEAWKSGQVEAEMEKLEQESLDLGINSALLEQFNEIFLYKRNRHMADGIAELLNNGKSVFAVVGAAHYAGDNNVVDYLKEKGFTVEAL